MKTELCLLLIAFGICSAIRYYNMKKKIKRYIVEKVIANHIIARDALNQLRIESKISVDECSKIINQSVNNSLDIILQACGDAYLDEFFDKILADKNN